jgi:hypothetical protein
LRKKPTTCRWQRAPHKRKKRKQARTNLLTPPFYPTSHKKNRERRKNKEREKRKMIRKDGRDAPLPLAHRPY